MLNNSSIQQGSGMHPAYRKVEGSVLGHRPTRDSLVFKEPVRSGVGAVIAKTRLREVEENHKADNLLFLARFKSRTPSKPDRQHCSKLVVFHNFKIYVGDCLKPRRPSPEDIINATSSVDLRVCEMEKEELKFLAISSRDSALCLQNHISKCKTKYCISKISEMASENIRELLCHATGNYTIQRLIKREASFASNLSSYCKSHFFNLAANEYASRAMQILIETQKPFRVFALTTFRRNLEAYLGNFSSVFLASSAIKAADNETQRDIFGHMLYTDLGKSLSKKNFKRLVISYITSCSYESLATISELISDLYPKLDDFFQDKYSVLLLLAFAERNYKPLVNKLLNSVLHWTPGTLRSDMFEYFTSQLTSRDALAGFSNQLACFLFLNLDTQLWQASATSSVHYKSYSRLFLGCLTYI